MIKETIEISNLSRGEIVRTTKVKSNILNIKEIKKAFCQWRNHKETHQKQKCRTETADNDWKATKYNSRSGSKSEDEVKWNFVWRTAIPSHQKKRKRKKIVLEKEKKKKRNVTKYKTHQKNISFPLLCVQFFFIIIILHCICIVFTFNFSFLNIARLKVQLDSVNRKPYQRW